MAETEVTETQSDPDRNAREDLLRAMVQNLLIDLKNGSGEKDKRRQVEDWMKSLAEKYPDFKIEAGLRDYYLAEAERHRAEFDKAADLIEKLNLGRSVEGFLDKAAELERRSRER